MTQPLKDEPSASGNDDGAIGARVRKLVQEHTLSVIAQRTETATTNVHRYANGGRVPAAFCAALAAALSVNPVWLLTGDGAPYLTDTRGTSAALASGMRELMDAMNAVSRLSLGRVSYRKDLGMVRDLASAAASHAQLRQKLGAQIQPVARQWLAALNEALQKRDRERAQDILDALDRLVSFSDDEALRNDLDRYRALHAYVMGRREDAADLQRRNLLRRLAESGEVTEATMRETFNLCAALSGLGRIAQGRRFAEATLVLRGDGPQWPIQRMLRSILGMFEFGLGNVQRGLALITDAYVNRTAEDAGSANFLMPTVLLRTGAASIESVLRDYPASVQLGVEVVRHALLQEDVTVLQAVLAHLESARLASLGAVQLFVTQARWVLAVLQGRRRRPEPQELAALEAPLLLTPVLGQIEVEVLRCQRARLLKQRAAVRLARRAQVLFEQVPPDVTLDHLTHGIHARNLLALAPAHRVLNAAAMEARNNLQRLAAQGMGMFRGMLG